MQNGRATSHADHPATNRMRAASVRAFDALAALRRRADRLCEELDEVTAPHGIPNTELHDEDSAVTTIEEARATHERVAALKSG